MGVGGQRHAPAALSPGKGRGTYSQEVGWVPRRFCKGAKDVAPTETRSQELLYKIINKLHRLPPQNLSQIFSKFGTIKPILYMAATSCCPQTSHILNNLHFDFSILK